jgi:hypothetical protein
MGKSLKKPAEFGHFSRRLQRGFRYGRQFYAGSAEWPPNRAVNRVSGS